MKVTTPSHTHFLYHSLTSFPKIKMQNDALNFLLQL